MATAIAGWAHTPFGTYDNESVESVIASSQGTGGGQEQTVDVNAPIGDNHFCTIASFPFQLARLCPISGESHSR